MGAPPADGKEKRGRAGQRTAAYMQKHLQDAELKCRESSGHAAAVWPQPIAA